MNRVASVPGAGATGGWRWHLRAMRSSARWAEARTGLDSWLAAIPCPLPDHLVWIGASAGWMIPPSWVRRFARVDVLDLDPWARPLFAIRHGRLLDRAGVRWAWHRLNALARLDEVLARWPDAAILFDNLLGQQIYRCAEGDALEEWLGCLHRSLEGCLWGSVHDWLSGPARLASGGRLEPVGFQVCAEPGGKRRIVAAPYSGESVHSPHSKAPPGELGGERLIESLHRRAGGHGVWQDHRTGEVFPAGTQGLLIPWRFSRSHLHWLKAAWVDARGY